MPGVTNTASTHPILLAGVESGSGSACQPNYHGDLALAPRPPIDLDYMEHDALRSMHGHAPVVHDRLVTDHHEIHHTIDSGIKSSLGGMHSHVTVGVASEDDPRRDAVVSNEPAISSDALSPPRLLELWEAEIDSILQGYTTVYKLQTALETGRLEVEFEACMQPAGPSQGVEALAPATASTAPASPTPQLPGVRQQHLSRGTRGGHQVRQRMRRKQAALVPRPPPMAPRASPLLAPCASLSLAPRV